jgi:hypothetical protein
MFICSLANAQELIKVEGKGYVGYSIGKEHPLLLGTPKRFIPKEDQIAKLESQLNSEIKIINNSRPNQYKECPIIDKNLKNIGDSMLGTSIQKETL